MADRNQAVCLFLVIVSVCFALYFRVTDLDRKPLHTDEAVQGMKFGELLEENHYLYDPVEYHGPTLYYLTLPVAWLQGATSLSDLSIDDLRLVPVLFGTAIILLLLMMWDGLGPRAAAIASMMLALSSPLVYYSRYYIQEMLLVFFCTLLIAAGWRAVQSGRKSWFLVAGVAAGMAHASKETCIISFAAMVLAIAAGWLSMAKHERPALITSITARGMGLGLFTVCALCVSLLFFSSFFSNARGPIDSVLTYLNYFGKASAASGHEKPVTYYLSLLFWYKPFPGYNWTELVMLTCFVLGCGTVLVGKSTEGRRPFHVFLIVYSLFQFLIYSLISYKTPWLMLNFVVPMVLVGGIGVANVYSACKTIPLRLLVLALLVGGFGQVSSQSCKASFELHSDWRNPYAYSQTVAKYVEMEERIYALAELCDGKETPISVVAENYWPLPWTLRAYSNTGYYDAMPAQLDAPIIIVDEGQFDAMEETYSENYIGQLFSLRPELPIYMYVRMDTWSAFMETQQ